MGPALSGIKYIEAVEADVRPSRWAAAALALLGAVTILGVTLMPVGALPRLVVAAGVAVATRDAIRVVALRRGRRGVRAFRVERSRSIRVRDGAGGECTGVLRDGSFVAPWLTIVRWRAAGARFDRTFLLVPGKIAREDFRRLRVLLRWA